MRRYNFIGKIVLRRGSAGPLGPTTSGLLSPKLIYLAFVSFGLVAFLAAFTNRFLRSFYIRGFVITGLRFGISDPATSIHVSPGPLR